MLCDAIICIILGLSPTLLPQAPAPAPPQPVEADRPLAAPAADGEILRLIRELGDPSYEKRIFATRRLCAIGPRARSQLLSAADGEDFEAALRAKNLLSTFDRMFFRGIDISVEFSKSRIAWDEPVDLRITMTSRSEYAAHIPFEGRAVDGRVPADNHNDAAQVGVLLDIADWLIVRRPDGSSVELRVNDIRLDAAVEAVVESRSITGPTSLLETRQRLTVTLRAFNRGFARYPLLDKGEYSVIVDYMPQWDDDVLLAQRIGRVVSNEGVITVTKGAPSGVSRAGIEVSLQLEQRGGTFVATLTNHNDQSRLLNKNFGSAPPFAAGRWIYTLGDAVHELPVEVQADVARQDFDAALLISVRPGQSVELWRGSVRNIRQRLAEAGAILTGARWTLHFHYLNVCDRIWQQQQGLALLNNAKAPPIFQVPLPAHLTFVRQTSNALTAPTETPK